MKKLNIRCFTLLLAGLACACNKDADEVLPEIPDHVVDHAKELVIPEFNVRELLPLSTFAKTAELVELELPQDKIYGTDGKLEITNRGEALIRVNDKVVRFGTDGKKLNSYGFDGQQIIDYNYDPYNDHLLINTLNENNTATLTTYAMNGETISQHANHIHNYTFGVLDANHLVFYDRLIVGGSVYTVTDMNLVTKNLFDALPEENAALGITTIRRQNQVLYAYCRLSDTPYRITADGLELLYRFNYTGPGNWGHSLQLGSSHGAYCSGFYLTDHYLLFHLVNAESSGGLGVKNLSTMEFYSGSVLFDDVSGASLPYIYDLEFQQAGDKLYILTSFFNDEGVVWHYLYTCTF